MKQIGNKLALEKLIVKSLREFKIMKSTTFDWSHCSQNGYHGTASRQYGRCSLWKHNFVNNLRAPKFS